MLSLGLIGQQLRQRSKELEEVFLGTIDDLSYELLVDDSQGKLELSNN
jgi:hypothetical protein